MAEPKRDNLLLMPKKRRSELSSALRELLEPDRFTRGRPRIDDDEDEFETADSLPDTAEEPMERDHDLSQTVSAPAEVEKYEGDDFEEEEDERTDVVACAEDAGSSSAAVEGGIAYIPVGAVSFSPYQTREIVSDSELEALSQSLLEKGLIQPIVVRPVDSEEGSQAFELVAGERRYRAARHAGLADIPAIVRELSDQESAELAVIENAQRENLNPIEEALAFKTLADMFKMPQREIARLVGKSRVVVTNALRLLQLEEEILEYIKSGDLTTGHGKALLALGEPKAQRRLARRAVKNELSVRALESLVAKVLAGEEEEEVDEDEERLIATVRRAETRLRNMLEMEMVKLSFDPQGRRRLQLTFETEAAWRRFMSRVRD